jgi:O-antigen/teichoic acid export membrane protein
LSLRKIAAGTAAMASVNVLRILSQVLVLPVLSRFLSPADYGIVGIAMPFILFAMMLADAGIGMSLVRTPATEREEWSTCFWLSVLFGFVLAIIVVGLAPLAATLFSEPSLSPIVMTLAVIVFLQAIFLIPRAAQQQCHQFHIIAATEMSSIVVGIGTAVLIAVYGGGAWALVGQQLAFFAVRIGLTLWFTPFRPLLMCDFHRAKEHLAFGRDLLSTNIVGFFTKSLDNIIVGKALGTAAVGIYSMSFQFARLPMMLIAGPLQYVLYAQLARIKEDREAIGRTFLTVTRILAILSFPAVGMIAAAHQPVFKLLVSDKWAASGDLFMIVAPVCVLQAVTSIGGTIRMVLGRTDITLRTTIEFCMIWIITLLIVVRFGLNWTALSYNIASLTYFPRAMMFVLPVIGVSLSSYLRTIVPPIGLTLVGIAVYKACLCELVLGDWPQLFLGGTLAIAGIIGSAFVQRRTLFEEMAMLQQIMRTR